MALSDSFQPPRSDNNSQKYDPDICDQSEVERMFTEIFPKSSSWPSPSPSSLSSSSRLDSSFDCDNSENLSEKESAHESQSIESASHESAFRSLEKDNMHGENESNALSSSFDDIVSKAFSLVIIGGSDDNLQVLPDDAEPWMKHNPLSYEYAENQDEREEISDILRMLTVPGRGCGQEGECDSIFRFLISATEGKNDQQTPTRSSRKISIGKRMKNPTKGSNRSMKTSATVQTCESTSDLDSSCQTCDCKCKHLQEAPLLPTNLKPLSTIILSKKSKKSKSSCSCGCLTNNEKSVSLVSLVRKLKYGIKIRSNRPYRVQVDS